MVYEGGMRWREREVLVEMPTRSDYGVLFHIEGIKMELTRWVIIL